MATIKRFTPNKTTEFYRKLNTLLYFVGLPDFWIEDVKLPKTFVKIYNVFIQVLNLVVASYVAMMFLSLFTQNNLSQEQRFMHNIQALMVPTVYFYYLVLINRRTQIREIWYQIGVLLKEVHNDKKVEKEMIKNVKFFVNLFLWSGTVLHLQGGVILINKFIRGEPLVTVMTAWPDVTDASLTADIVRCIIYVIGWLEFLRTVGSHTIIFVTFIGLSHQFKNTQSYFYNIDNIFKQLYLSQEEKEEQYEKAFKAGIQMHETTLWCTKQCQSLCGIIINNQAIQVTFIEIPIIFDAMKPDNSSVHKILPFMVLLFASYFWICAGNIKIEASKVSDAMYSSGWQNCYGKSSIRVRKLVIIAMTRAQKPVVLKAFSFIELSYEAFWNLIKSAYITFLFFF